jgi:epoxyqueuosine reductase QueG
MDKLAHKHIGNISVYAQNEDYHDVMKKKLKAPALAGAFFIVCGKH